MPLKTKQSYRMSEAGYCVRFLAAKRLNYKPLPEPEFLKLAGKEGSRHEDWIISELIEEGHKITERQKEVKLEFPSFDLIGHIDGRADDKVLEIKALGRFNFQKFEKARLSAFPQYQAQITCYMEATKLPAWLLVKNRDTGGILETVLDSPPLDFQSIYDSLLTVELYALKNLLHPAVRQDDFTCRICRFRYLCLDEMAEAKVVSAIQLPLAQYAGQWRQAKAKIDEATALKEEAEQIFLQAVKDAGLKKLFVSGLNISYVSEGERESYPLELLRKVVPEEMLSQARKVSTRNEYIRVTDTQE